MTTAGIVLAAGAGTRFHGDTHKLLAPFGDSTVIETAVRNAVVAGLDEVIVVTGAVDLPVLGDVTRVSNPRWVDGMATSLQAGLRAAAGHHAVVVGVGDQPGVPAEAWRLVAAATATPIAAASYAGQRGSPVRLASDIWSELPRTGDEGARVLMRDRPDLVTEVPCPGSGADVDTLEDLRRWSS